MFFSFFFWFGLGNTFIFPLASQNNNNTKSIPNARGEMGDGGIIIRTHRHHPAYVIMSTISNTNRNRKE